MKYEEVRLSQPIIDLCSSYNFVFEEYEKMYNKIYKMYKSKNLLLYPYKKLYKQQLDELDEYIFNSYSNLGKMIDNI